MEPRMSASHIISLRYSHPTSHIAHVHAMTSTSYIPHPRTSVSHISHPTPSASHNVIMPHAKSHNTCIPHLTYTAVYIPHPTSQNACTPHDTISTSYIRHPTTSASHITQCTTSASHIRHPGTLVALCKDTSDKQVMPKNANKNKQTTPYLSGTLGFMPTRSVFRGRCHCCLIYDR